MYTQALETWRGHPLHLNSPCADSECRSQRKKYIRTGAKPPCFSIPPGPLPPVAATSATPQRSMPDMGPGRGVALLRMLRHPVGGTPTARAARPGGGRPGGGHEWGPGCAQAQRPGPGHGPPPHLHPVPASGPLSRPCRGATSEMITSGNSSSGRPSISRTRWAASKMQ